MVQVRGAPFFCVVFAVHIGVGVLEQRDARRASLLRAPTDDAGLIDVEISRTGTAAPFVFAAIDEIVLKPIPPGIAAGAFALDLFVNFLFTGGESLVEPVAVVNDADR